MANLLASETSPYLLLHKDNTVDWRTWNEAALEEAREQNKPILLSVGYTACHWCHVMEEESFADPETAALMNELFVNIKVDREERPDLDQIYQTAAQALGSNGGWPLTVFLTPQGEPYFAGTYYPKEERYGQPTFKHVLQEVARIWREQNWPMVVDGFPEFVERERVSVDLERVHEFCSCRLTAKAFRYFSGSARRWN